MMFLTLISIIEFVVVVNGERDTFGCTSTYPSTSPDTCIIDPYVWFPTGYGEYSDNAANHNAADLVCDPQYPNCVINCIDGAALANSCGVYNRKKSKYMNIYCPSLSSAGGQAMGSCEINADGNFAMKYAKVNGGTYNTLTLNFNSLSDPAQITSPGDGGSLILNRPSLSSPAYPGGPKITISTDTNNVILNCGDNDICTDSATIDASDINGELKITAASITDRVIHCPTDPNSAAQCNIDCTQTCTNTDIYTKDGYVKLG